MKRRDLGKEISKDLQDRRKIIKDSIKGHEKMIRDSVQEIKNKINVKFINRLIMVFGIGLAVIVGLIVLHNLSYIILPAPVLFVVQKLIIIIGLYLLAAIFVRISVNSIVGIFKDSEIEHKILLGKFYTAFVYLVTTTIVLYELGVSAQQIAIVVGLLASAIALSIRDMFSSFIAWFVLLTKRPFRIGDYIKVGEYRGRVKHIGTFFVMLDDSPETVEDFVKVPNQIFMQQAVTNFGRDTLALKLSIPLERIPSDIDKRIDALSKKLVDELGEKIEAVLEPEKDRWYVIIDFRSRFDEKTGKYNKILRLSIRELHDLLKK